MDSSSLEKGLLMVGAGGIGSEVAHLLVQKYRGRLVIVDMDTIELSNLNRQAFFTEKDINKHKAEVLASAVRNLSKGAIETSFFTSSIAESKFNTEFFQSFDCILSCVDNIEAREHINTMAVITNISVVESGSSGYNGQVQIILPGVTECYACTESVPQKHFPMCTLRGIPEKWHHCVQWAEYDFMPRLSEQMKKPEYTQQNTPENNLIEDLLSLYGLDPFLSTSEKKDLLEIVLEQEKTEEKSIETLHIIAGIKAKKYNIEIQPLQETKEIVKKTIPSVITTNAIVASIILLQIRELKQKRPHGIYYTSYSRPIVKALGPKKPNPNCEVCSYKPHIIHTRTTQTLLNILESLSINPDSIIAIIKGESLIYDEEYTDLLQEEIGEIGIKQGTILKIQEKENNHLLYIETEK